MQISKCQNLAAIGLSVALFFSTGILAQSKGDNTIIVGGVDFATVCSALLDAGFAIEKKDSDLQTAKTELKAGSGKNKWMKLLFNARVKDSTLYLTGQWYNTLSGGPVESEVQPIANTFGNPKSCFKEMNAFALSFGKPITYKKM